PLVDSRNLVGATREFGQKCRLGEPAGTKVTVSPGLQPLLQGKEPGPLTHPGDQFAAAHRHAESVVSSGGKPGRKVPFSITVVKHNLVTTLPLFQLQVVGGIESLAPDVEEQDVGLCELPPDGPFARVGRRFHPVAHRCKDPSYVAKERLFG